MNRIALIPFFWVPLLLAAPVLFSNASWGQALNIKDISPGSAITTTPTLVYGGLGTAGIPGSMSSLLISNPSTGVVYCGFKSTIAANGAGTIQLAANGGYFFWPAGSAPKQAVWCLAATTSSIGVFIGY